MVLPVCYLHHFDSAVVLAQVAYSLKKNYAYKIKMFYKAFCIIKLFYEQQVAQKKEEVSLGEEDRRHFLEQIMLSNSL